MTKALYAEVRRVLAEFGRADLPVVANMDFGPYQPSNGLAYRLLGDDRSSAKRLAVIKGAVK
jgi:hypothetical protein